MIYQEKKSKTWENIFLKEKNVKENQKGEFLTCQKPFFKTHNKDKTWKINAKRNKQITTKKKHTKPSFRWKMKNRKIQFCRSLQGYKKRFVKKVADGEKKETIKDQEKEKKLVKKKAEKKVKETGKHVKKKKKWTKERGWTKGGIKEVMET